MASSIHPTAIIESDVVIGEGSRIWHFCHVMSGARIGADVVVGQNGFIAGGVEVGDGCRIQNNVSLYSGVRLGAGVFVGPSAVFTNVVRPRARFPRKECFAATEVGEGATIGANATIVCGHRVGVCSFIGAGAVVTQDVADYAVVVGNPARLRGFACRCGENLPLAARPADGEAGCHACGRRYVVRAGVVSESAAG